MVWPRFSPRPILTCALAVIGNSQTSPLLCAPVAAGTCTVTLPSATVSLTGKVQGDLPRVLRDRALDRALVGTERVHHAVDHGLRRIDLAVAARDGVFALQRGIAVQRERVLPAEIIPVVDRQAHGDQRGILRELAHQPVGRRTGRAALAGEQLHDGARLSRRGRRGGGAGERGGEDDRCGSSSACSAVRVASNERHLTRPVDHPPLTSR